MKDTVNTILAALRFYQAAGQGDPANRSDDIQAIACPDDDCTSLDSTALDTLCEQINTGAICVGASFADCVDHYASRRDDAMLKFVECARKSWHEEGSCEVDAKAIVSAVGDGAYVMGWLWVSNEDAGIEGCIDCGGFNIEEGTCLDCLAEDALTPPEVTSNTPWFGA